MRLRESIQLDDSITERRASLSRKDLDEFEMDTRILSLAVLIEARNKLDEIANRERPKDVVEHITFAGTDETGRKINPRRPRSLRQRHTL
jgi:hypothetical protein